ncbi:MAG: hypothetical protein A4E63_00596 [Syntrophorhabdus sp. PtaU1.Bin050]|nr:MAG: hypothetical protein A4E63_00596 [Syntrophorhabdus sp. PtaU1.Bin050]
MPFNACEQSLRPPYEHARIPVIIALVEIFHSPFHVRFLNEPVHAEACPLVGHAEYLTGVYVSVSRLGSRRFDADCHQIVPFSGNTHPVGDCSPETINIGNIMVRRHDNHDGTGIPLQKRNGCKAYGRRRIPALGFHNEVLNR